MTEDDLKKIRKEVYMPDIMYGFFEIVDDSPNTIRYCHQQFEEAGSLNDF